MKTLGLFLCLVFPTATLAAAYSVRDGSLTIGAPSAGGAYQLFGRPGPGTTARSTAGPYVIDFAATGVVGSHPPAPTGPPPPVHVTVRDGQLILSWAADTESFVLQKADRVGRANWVDLGAIPQRQGPEMRLTLPIPPGPSFFRLRSQ